MDKEQYTYREGTHVTVHPSGDDVSITVTTMTPQTYQRTVADLTREEAKVLIGQLQSAVGRDIDPVP